ncbi:MAG: hypothetical protein QM831_27080 [Kofleriaceae bacterium]
MDSRKRFAIPIAALLAIAALTSLVDSSIYAHETHAWAAQGRAQDWVNLFLVVPALLVVAQLASRGSDRALYVLAGAYAYVAYSYVVYAMAVHFNALFLVYCALVGLPAFALIELVPKLPAATSDRSAARALIAVAIVFALLWLGQIVPALVTGSTPGAIVDAGLATNPVYVLDLALVLPAMVIVGMRAYRGDARYASIVWAMLAFASFMLAAIIGIIVDST